MLLRCRLLALALLPLTGAVSPAFAQTAFESTGARALGMGGAFAGVADDGSATYWNPAGLPGVGIFEASLDHDRLDGEGEGSRLAADTPAWRHRTTRFGIATPVLAFTYGRMRFAGVPAGGAAGAPPEGRVVHAQQFGLTLAQSLGDAVVVGSTLRLVRAATEVVPLESGTAARAAVRQIAQREGDAGTYFDADIGVMAWIGRLRLGLVVRNVTAPTIEGPQGDRWQFERQARIGASFGGEPARAQRDWTIAADADITTTELPDGRRRSVAAGAERWWGGRRFALRGGARLQTVDDPRPAISGGLSVAVRAGVLIDAHGTRGEDRRDRGWGAGVRLTF